MKKVLILIVSMFVFILVVSGCTKGVNNSAPQQVDTSSESKKENEMETEKEPPSNVSKQKESADDVYEKAPSIELMDVAGGNADGKAWVAIKEGKTMHRVTAKKLPELTNGDFYEGWMVKQPAPGGFFSTGEMTFDEKEGEWVLDYETVGDKSEYRSVVITLEPNDGDPAPAAHILEGKFSQETNFEIN